ncbi:MAG TPA: hypothetical protein DD473_10385 [Planctomycetaceae bacterium]|nr:hypothetical protein [Planctomycetaceae bacterium]|tara:strand:+ start:385 stop:1173 length:789 start_codon:yes stop_codon:yes gene_type:complete
MSEKAFAKTVKNAKWKMFWRTLPSRVKNISSNQLSGNGGAMETTLHQQLKSRYCLPGSSTEQQLGAYRIDVVQGEHLIEVQCSSLAAIRDKIRELSPDYEMTVVKPIIRKRYITQRKWSQTLGRRLSPKSGSWMNIFEEMVHFVTVFPQPRLTLELLLIDIDEIRRPPKKRWSRKGYRVEDRKLLEVIDQRILRVPADLYSLLPTRLPEQFSTSEIAGTLQVTRSFAQQIAYCLRESGAAEAIGKTGNAIQYQKVLPHSKAA